MPVSPLCHLGQMLLGLMIERHNQSEFDEFIFPIILQTILYGVSK